MKRLKYEFVKKQFALKGYKLLDKDYISNNIPLLIEKDGYKTYIKYANFSMGETPSFFSFSNPCLYDNICALVKKYSPSTQIKNIKQVTKSKKKRVLLSCVCECGKPFDILFDSVKRAKSCVCPACVKKRQGIKRRSSFENFISFANTKGYKVIETPKDFIYSSKVEVEDKDGYRGYINYNTLKRNCHFEVFSIKSNKKYFLYNLNMWAKNNNIKTTAISLSDENKWTRTPVLFRCECGRCFSTSIGSFQSGKYRCDECTRLLSKYEYIVKEFLKKNKIKFIYQFRINSCKDILPLPFDFYLCDYNTLIEIDGEGHYKPCNFNQIGYEDSLKTFLITQKHDKIKNEYCTKYNINLVRIPYWEVQDNSYIKKINQLIEK